MTGLSGGETILTDLYTFSPFWQYSGVLRTDTDKRTDGIAISVSSAAEVTAGVE